MMLRRRRLIIIDDDEDGDKDGNLLEALSAFSLQPSRLRRSSKAASALACGR